MVKRTDISIIKNSQSLTVEFPSIGAIAQIILRNFHGDDYVEFSAKIDVNCVYEGHPVDYALTVYEATVEEKDIDISFLSNKMEYMMFNILKIQECEAYKDFDKLPTLFGHANNEELFWFPDDKNSSKIRTK